VKMSHPSCGNCAAGDATAEGSRIARIDADRDGNIARYVAENERCGRTLNARDSCSLCIFTGNVYARARLCSNVKWST